MNVCDLPRFLLRSLFTIPALATMACTMMAGLPSTAPGTALPTGVTAAPTSEAGWEPLVAGLERRIVLPGNSNLVQLYVLRIDPAVYIFRAHYHPGAPERVVGWRQILASPVVIINANFFTPEHTINGLLVSDGNVYGAAYPGFGGLFTIQEGAARVRSGEQEPYRGEALEQAIQGFPMLVVNGRQAYTDARPDRATRRTAIAQDSQGRILLMVTPLGGITLLDLSAALAESDLEIVNAFNLDGGGSTLLALDVPGISPYTLASVDPVPAVLAVYAR